VPKLSPVKNWGTSKVSAKVGFVSTVNNCMDCHWPHSSVKAKYLR
jgi:Zn-finger protein